MAPMYATTFLPTAPLVLMVVSIGPVSDDTLCDEDILDSNSTGSYDRSLWYRHEIRLTSIV